MSGSSDELPSVNNHDAFANAQPALGSSGEDFLAALIDVLDTQMLPQVDSHSEMTDAKPGMPYLLNPGAADADGGVFIHAPNLGLTDSDGNPVDYLEVPHDGDVAGAANVDNQLNALAQKIYQFISTSDPLADNPDALMIPEYSSKSELQEEDLEARDGMVPLVVVDGQLYYGNPNA